MKILAYCILLLNLLACTYTTDARTVQSENEAMKERNIPGNSYQPKKAWQQNGTLVPGANDKFVTLQADFSEDPGYYTVQFNTSANILPGTDGYIRCKADIIWSVEGGEITRRVSVGNGISVSGAGQALRVVVSDDGSNPDIGGGFNEYVVGIVVVKGTRPATGKPVTYKQSGVLSSVSVAAGALTPGELAIPGNIGVISAEVTITPQSAGAVFPLSMIVEFAAANGDTFSNYYITSDTPPLFLPVPAGATQCNIYNEGVSNIVAAVTWGIDG